MGSMKSLRILIPGVHSPDSFEDNVSETLADLGHNVYRLKTHPSGWLRRIQSLGREMSRKVGKSSIFPEERLLLRISKEWRPDMVLCLTRSLSEECLQQLEQLRISLRVCWWGDAPGNLRYFDLLSNRWTAIFAKDRDLVKKLRCVGLNSFHLLEAMNPKWHRPFHLEPNREVVVAGSCYGYRQFIVKQLASSGINVAFYGNPPPYWADPAVKLLHSNRYIVKEEKSRIFNAGMACLNSTALSEADALNCRAFEIAGAAGLQLMEYRSAISECFEIGREILVYASFDELVDQLKQIRGEPRRFDGIRAAAASRAHSEHTYSVRLSAMLKQLGV
jgi:spore maturation protein CgeB